MQGEKDCEGAGKSIEILDQINTNCEKVVEVEKPIEKHDSKILKEYGSKQLVRVFHDVYEVFCGLSKGHFT